MVLLMAQVVKDESNDTLAGVDDAHQACHIESNFHFSIYDISSRLVRLETILSRYDTLKRVSYHFVCCVR